MPFIAYKLQPNGSVSNAHKLVKLEITGLEAVATISSYATVTTLEATQPLLNWQDTYSVPLSCVSAPEAWLVGTSGPFSGGILITQLEPLESSQARKWYDIKLQRSDAEYAGFTWDGSVFDSDAASQSKIQGSVQLAALIPNLTLGWTLADNTTRVLSSADMVQVGVALGTHVMTQFAISQQLRELIFNATTVEEVEAIAWPSM